MINKFQQGGAAPQQGGGILALIQQLPQDKLQLLMQAFAQWAQLKGVDIQQLQLNPQALEQALGQFMQEMQAQLSLMARHGAKLQYIKSLKHQCAEDLHLEYFAKGGTVGCKCVQNQKKGGAVEPKKNAIEQFKSKKGINLKKDKCGGKMKKHQIGGTLETLRQSLGLEKKNLNKFQYGGPVERTDNTRVASGRPQQVNNKIPYGAGKGPAADSPMYLLDANITSNPNILTGAPTLLPGRFISPKIARQFRRYSLGIVSNPYIKEQAYANTMARTGGDVVKANEVASSVANHELLAQFLRDRFTNNLEWLYRTLLGGALAGSSYAGVKMNPNK